MTTRAMSFIALDVSCLFFQEKALPADVKSAENFARASRACTHKTVEGIPMDQTPGVV